MRTTPKPCTWNSRKKIHHKLPKIVLATRFSSHGGTGGRFSGISLSGSDSFGSSPERGRCQGLGVRTNTEASIGGANQI